MSLKLVYLKNFVYLSPSSPKRTFWGRVLLGMAGEVGGGGGGGRRISNLKSVCRRNVGVWGSPRLGVSIKFILYYK